MIKRANYCGGLCTVFKHDCVYVFFPEMHVFVEEQKALRFHYKDLVLKMNKRLAALERHEGE